MRCSCQDGQEEEQEAWVLIVFYVAMFNQSISQVQVCCSDYGTSSLLYTGLIVQSLVYWAKDRLIEKPEIFM